VSNDDRQDRQERFEERDMMEFFATNGEVARLETDLTQAGGEARQPLLLALAWQLRERDTVRALQLADEVEAMPRGPDQTPEARQTVQLRLILIRGEAKWLAGEFEAASALAQQALAGYTELHYPPGCADAHWLLGWVAYDQGDMARADAAFYAMVIASANRDPVRMTLAQAALARNHIFRDLASARARWGTYFADMKSSSMHPALATWVEDVAGTLASLDGDHVQCIRHNIQTWRFALESGQIRRALNAAINVGHTFNRLNDYHTALEWMERALALAREKGWPGMIGAVLKDTAETLRHLRRFDDAHHLLREALALMAPMAESRYYGIALRYLGDIELARKQYTSALDVFLLLEHTALPLKQTDLICGARRGQAEALLELGQPQRALHAAHAALGDEKIGVSFRIAALQVLAAIHRRYALPPPPGMQAVNPALHYLEQALDLARSIADGAAPANLLDSVAQEYAALGDYQQAWLLGQQAVAARDKKYATESDNRSQAMQVSQQTGVAESLQAERLLAQHLKQAETLLHTSQTIFHALCEYGASVLADAGADDKLTQAGRDLSAALQQLEQLQQLQQLQPLPPSSPLSAPGGSS
jgi:tetratricopeptide (TPR) repeat protein